MNKLFRCKVNWYNDNKSSYITDDIVLAASDYVNAAAQLIDYYGDELAVYSIYELQNPCLVEDLT